MTHPFRAEEYEIVTTCDRCKKKMKIKDFIAKRWFLILVIILGAYVGFKAPGCIERSDEIMAEAEARKAERQKDLLKCLDSSPTYKTFMNKCFDMEMKKRSPTPFSDRNKVEAWHECADIILVKHCGYHY